MHATMSFQVSDHGAQSTKRGNDYERKGIPSFERNAVPRFRRATYCRVFALGVF